MQAPVSWAVYTGLDDCGQEGRVPCVPGEGGSARAVRTQALGINKSIMVGWQSTHHLSPSLATAALLCPASVNLPDMGVRKLGLDGDLLGLSVDRLLAIIMATQEAIHGWRCP